MILKASFSNTSANGVVGGTFLGTIFFLFCLESSALSLVSLSSIVFMGRALTCLVALYEKIMISPRKSWYEVIQFIVTILTLLYVPKVEVVSNVF